MISRKIQFAGRALAGIALLLTLPSCSAEPSARGPDSPQSVPAGTGKPEKDQQIMLLADGIGSKEGGKIAFGADKAAAVGLVAHLGPLEERGGEECGGGPMQFTHAASIGLTLNFQQDKFVGWFIDSGGGMALTEGGITVGSSRAALDSALPNDIQTDSTLGVEFLAPRKDDTFIGGFLSSAGADGKVESLYAGMTCFFR